MSEGDGIKRLLVLRKLTRAIADLLRVQVKEYFTTLAPLLRPSLILGPYLEGAGKETVQGADKAFKELQTLYEAIAGSKLYGLRKELRTPLALVGSAIEITPMEYIHEVPTDQGSKAVTVTSPLKWVLSYAGYAPGRITYTDFAPGRLRELLADRNRSGEELQQFVLHYLALHLVATRQAGVAKILDALRFPISTGRSTEFGELPITFVSAPLTTIRPPDNVILESTEISGKDAFEEIIDLDALAALRDPLKDRLLELARAYGEALPTS
ncbi:MAG: hypothetical protein IRY99_18955 [Isosphaeraceae bacterium]|nr:hypothetical protein [Isosphaeraceae bacterium]